MLVTLRGQKVEVSSRLDLCIDKSNQYFLTEIKEEATETRAEVKTFDQSKLNHVEPQEKNTLPKQSGKCALFWETKQFDWQMPISWSSFWNLKKKKYCNQIILKLQMLNFPTNTTMLFHRSFCEWAHMTTTRLLEEKFVYIYFWIFKLCPVMIFYIKIYYVSSSVSVALEIRI